MMSCCPKKGFSRTLLDLLCTVNSWKFGVISVKTFISLLVAFSVIVVVLFINPVKIDFRGLSFSFIREKLRGAFEIVELACAVSYTNRVPDGFFFFCQLGWASSSLSVT
ncbi:hypothetical protein SETIT_5G058600v2 [Setaria italica]|uniref:Uncharacterized protein n=1 Tax=Setaria italica TaxID=4555 RepID=A0A368R213_SETIT|nr:hypothetical protein SETIT_5G058600v2 [Setaria italica]